MAKALKCDRCGGFFDCIEGLRNYRIREFSELNRNEKYVDLCPDCYAKLLMFLDLDNPDKSIKTEKL